MKRILFYNILGAIHSNDFSEILILFEYFRNMYPCHRRLSMAKNYEQSVEINHNRNWPCIPDHHYRILISGGSGSEKTNALLNLITHKQPYIDKTYLYV